MQLKDNEVRGIVYRGTFYENGAIVISSKERQVVGGYRDAPVAQRVAEAPRQ